MRILLVFCVSLFVLAGCNENNNGNRNLVTTESLFEQGLTTEQTEGITNQEDESVELEDSNSEVDIDLTKLSSSLVYAQVNDMVTESEEYIGKTIKIEGPYIPLYYEETDSYYHYILIEDALACCQSGIEFIWDDNSHEYPAEYPNEGENISICGEFKTYKELDYTYYYLEISEIAIVSE